MNDFQETRLRTIRIVSLSAIAFSYGAMILTYLLLRFQHVNYTPIIFIRFILICAFGVILSTFGLLGLLYVRILRALLALKSAGAWSEKDQAEKSENEV